VCASDHKSDQVQTCLVQGDLSRCLLSETVGA
jgi:hypothetical protein